MQTMHDAEGWRARPVQTLFNLLVIRPADDSREVFYFTAQLFLLDIQTLRPYSIC